MRNRLLMGRLLYICVGFFLGNLAGCSASHFLPGSKGIIPTVTERAKFFSCDAQAHGDTCLGLEG